MDELKRSIATLINVMDLYGDAPYPIFERLTDEYEALVSCKDKIARYRELTKDSRAS